MAKRRSRPGARRDKAQRPSPPGRPSWDEYFLNVAAVVASRSTCLRRHIGAVLVLDKRILATGYNGAPSGLPHCSETGCLRQEMRVPSGERHELCRGLHAEMNALLQAARHGMRISGATLYSTCSPCSLCAKMLINGGIARIVAVGQYPDKLAREVLRQAGIAMEIRKTPPPFAPARGPRHGSHREAGKRRSDRPLARGSGQEKRVEKRWVAS